MSDLTVKQLALLYLYSTRNIVASCVALIGPALLFTGVIADFWLPLTIGLYAAGYFATPGPRVMDTDVAQSLSLEALIEQLDHVIKQAKPQLPSAMATQLDSIRASISEVLPRLSEGQSFDNNLFTVRETVVRYLPETLANYLALPAAYRTTHVLKDRKTARDLLREQLTVLDDQMHAVVANVASGDAEALLANGKFLEAKFRERNFLNP
jgi:hypothetical protein